MNWRAALGVVLLAMPAHAVVVRGRVTDPLGRPLPGARVQLIRGPQSVADAITGADGTYEIRSAANGRFLLLTSSSVRARFAAVQIGTPFYAGRTDVVEQDVFLDPAYLSPQVSAQGSVVPTPLPQLVELTGQVSGDELLTSAQPVFALRQLPSASVVQRGTAGTPAELHLRGAGPQTVKVEVAGATGEDLGGGFNLATLSTTGLANIDPAPALELTPGALPERGLNAEGGLLGAGILAARETRASLTVAGDAGNLSTLRGEGVGEITRKRADLRGGFSRFDTDSGKPVLGFHLASAALNAGYFISAGTSVRVEVRRDVTGAPLSVPRSIFTVQPLGEDAEQNLYSSLSFDTTSSKQWHNGLRYGLVRKRRQVRTFSRPVEPEVRLVGAGGFSVGGVPVLPDFAAREDRVTDRDELSYATDYALTPHHTLAGGLRYADERGAELLAQRETRVRRTHLGGWAGAGGNLFTGRLHHRLFYEAAGAMDHSAALGWLGAPRVGLTLVPVFAGTRRLRGTTLHAVAAAGFGEPTVAADAFAETTGTLARAPRSRTFSLGADQVILPQKLTLRATYFHGQYAHQDEPLGLDRVSPTLGYRAQGVEVAVHYQPFPRLFLAGGGTYLAALVEQTAQAAAFNPALPGQAIGVLGALRGSRPFERPPLTGWIAAHYTGSRFSAALDGSFAGRSDSSSGVAGTPGLLLPNRDLSPGYADWNASVLYRVGAHVAVYSQVENLLDDRHVAPFGYLSTPVLIRTGLRLRLGGD